MNYHFFKNLKKKNYNLAIRKIKIYFFFITKVR
jgi:hypothetical protein